MSSIESILIVARLTLREAVRRRLLWALVGLTVLIVVLTWWGFSRIAEVIAGHRARSRCSASRRFS